MRDFNRSDSRDRRFGSRDSGNRSFGARDNNARPMMFQTVCDDCGNNCEVPFKPSGAKPVYCSNCFEKHGGNERSDRNENRYDRNDRPERSDRYERNDRNSFGGERDSRDREMFPATCDECGKPCKLPFKPSSDKPVYCSDCFEMRGERSGANKFDNSRNADRSERSEKGNDLAKEVRELKDQVLSLNIKLDKVMNALNIKPEKVREPKTVKVSKEKMAKVETESAKSEAAEAVVENTVVEAVAPVAKKKAVKKAVKKTAVKKAAKKAE